MVENNPRSGESHQAGAARPSLNPTEAWSALLDVLKQPVVPLQMSSKDGVRFVFDPATGQEAFVIPDSKTGIFNSKELYLNENQILSRLSTLNQQETRDMEKALKLKPSGVVGNPALVQRYMAEIRKASVNNFSAALAYSSGRVSALDIKPLGVLDQVNMSAMTGDLEGAGGPRRSRSISITQFSEGDARAILENFYADTVGRRPTDKEVKKFNSLINQQAKKQPSTSTTTYGADGTATTVSGGAGYSAADAQMAARKMAESDPEASAFLSSTRYLDAFMNTIGSQA